MSFWKESLENLVNGVDLAADRLRLKWRRFKGYEEPLEIIAYLGFGTPERLFLRGRVVEKPPAVTAQQTDNKRRNFRNFVRRFATDEVPHAVVRARYREAEQTVTADDEGYFHVDLAVAPAPAEADFREISLAVVEPLAKNGETKVFTGRVVVPAPGARFGVISDLDDTVITTNVNSKLRMLFNTAFRNEYTRLPFKGVAAFYRALQRGAGGEVRNPIFYVSSSPWNLYPFLTEFLRHNEIPAGPIFLKDFGNHTIFNASDHAGHKTEHIERILQTYPQMPFVLIGDSGEKDPEIYRDVLSRHPGQIKFIYIRSVNQNPERLAAIDRLAAEIAGTNCELILAPDTVYAAAHAVSAGLIDAAELPAIREEKKADLAKNEAGPEDARAAAPGSGAEKN